MELQNIECFVAVAEAKSMTRAAAILGIAQPVLSRRIRNLEEELCVKIFYRDGRGTQLTDEGARFYEAVRPHTLGLRQAKADLQAASGHPSGKVVLAIPPWMSNLLGAQLVADILQRFPRINLHLVAGLSGHINEWLVSGRVDLAVIADSSKSPLIHTDRVMSSDVLFFSTAEICQKLAPDTATISVRQLAGLPLILTSQNNAARRELDRAAQQTGISLNVVAEVDIISTLKQLVLQGLGSSALTAGSSRPEAFDPRFAVRRIVEPALSVDLMIATGLNRPQTDAMREVRKVLKHHIEMNADQTQEMGWTI